MGVGGAVSGGVGLWRICVRDIARRSCLKRLLRGGRGSGFEGSGGG